MSIETFNADARRFIELIVLRRYDDARQLLQRRPELISDRNRSGETPLHWLAIERQAEGVRMLLAAGADANTVANDGDGVLADAAGLGAVEVCRLLLAHGADPNRRGSFSDTPLHAAARHTPEPDVLDVLVAAGAELEARDGIEQTPLQNAASLGNDLAVLRLCGLGARVDVRDGFGATPLHEAAAQATEAAVIEALIQAGACIAACDGDGETPLIKAVRANNVVTARRLIQLGASVADQGDPPRAPAQALRADAPDELVELLRRP